MQHRHSNLKFPHRYANTTLIPTQFGAAAASMTPNPCLLWYFMMLIYLCSCSFMGISSQQNQNHFLDHSELPQKAEPFLSNLTVELFSINGHIIVVNVCDWNIIEEKSTILQCWILICSLESVMYCWNVFMLCIKSVHCCPCINTTFCFRQLCWPTHLI